MNMKEFSNEPSCSRLRLLFLLSLLTVVSFCTTNGQSQWGHIFNSVNVAGSYTVIEGIQTSDGGFLVAGGNGSSFGPANAFLMKLDNAGVVQWYNEYVGFHDFQSVIQTTDGGFLAGGRVNSSNPYLNSLLKTDALGNVTWARSIDNGTQGGICGLLETGAGYLCTFTTSFMVNSTGDSLLWNRLHVAGGGLANDIKSATGGYIACGPGQYGNPAPGYNAVLSKLDINGNIVWNRSFGGAEYDAPVEAEETTDGSIITGGWTTSFTNPLREAFLSRLDSVGNLLWGITYGDATLSTAGYSLRVAENGDYVVSGSIGSDILMFRTDPNGVIRWSKTYGPGTGYSVEPATDGGFFLVGRQSNNDLVVVKTDSAGNSLCSQDITLTQVSRSFTIGNNNVNVTLGNTNLTQALVQNSLPQVPTACSPPLAVQSLNLEAEYTTAGTVLLSWFMEGETEIRSWTVEKSLDGQEWEMLDVMQSANLSHYEDLNPDQTVVIYRVLLTEANGTQVYSNSVSVFPALEKSRVLDVYPQPVSNGNPLKVDLLIAGDEKVEIKVYDLGGRLVQQQGESFAQGQHQIQLPLQELQSGVYLLHISGDAWNYRKKIVIF